MAEPPRTPARVGRYLLYDEIARGGMASVHVGRLEGPAGFKRTVAVKRLHGTFGQDPELVSLFLDEARIAARIEHPNVVPVLDVVSVEREVLLVMEYVHGESLAELLLESQQRGAMAPLRLVAQIMVNVLTGLHAAHETLGDDGAPLHIIHRDVSPHNVMVSADGIARLVDFGIARAERRMTATTKEGNVRGKLAYLAPEQLKEGADVDRRADIHAAGLVFWEAVVGRRTYEQDFSVILVKKLSDEVDRASQHVDGLPSAVDDIIAKALARDPSRRFATALEMARAIEAAVPPVSPREIAEWVTEFAVEKLRERARVVASTSGSAEAGPLPRLGLVGAPAGSYVSSRDITLPNPRSRPKRALLGIAAVVALGAIGTCLAVTRSGRAPIAETSAGAPPSTSPSPVAAMPAPDVTGSSAAGEVAPPPAAPASAGMVPTPLASEPASAATTTRRKTKASTAPAKRPGCDPPWHIDERGVRILKKECF